MTPRQVTDVTGIKRAQVKLVLWRMAKEGQITNRGGHYASRAA
jgi:hypothetical protein